MWKHVNFLSLFTGLTQLLATSTNYSLLSEAWTLWRDATGPKMKSNYEQLVTLSNEAIKLASMLHNLYQKISSGRTRGGLLFDAVRIQLQ